MFQRHQPFSYINLGDGFNLFETYWSNGIISPGGGKTETCSKTPPSNAWFVVVCVAGLLSQYSTHKKADFNTEEKKLAIHIMYVKICQP